MKHVLMIATGGTIASRNSGAGLTPELTSKELLSAVPELNELCEITTVQPFNLDSTNVRSAHWIEIARLIEENYSDFDGFVVTHGTDTMAYTAAALSYLVQNTAKPVVLTGSQKSVYLRDTDARKNLYDAFAFCVDENAHGVRIVFDGRVIYGTRAKKTHTRSYNAFSSVDFPDVAIMREGKPFYYMKDEKPKGQTVFYHNVNPNVFVLKMTPDLRSDIFDFLSEHCDGLILETFGSGGLPNYENGEFYSKIKSFLDRGKTVVVTTQVEREGSALERYEVGRRLLACGTVIEAGCMTLEAALTKLMWCLSLTQKQEEVKRRFLSPVERDIF